MDDLVSTQPITEDDLKKIKEFVKDKDNIEYTEEDIANIMVSESEAEKLYRQKKIRDLKSNNSNNNIYNDFINNNINNNYENIEELYDDNGEILIKTQKVEEQPLNELPYSDILSRTNSDLFSNNKKNKILGLNTITSNLEDPSFSPEKLKNECFFEIPQCLNNNSNNSLNNSFNKNNNNNNSFDSLSSPNNIKRLNTINLNDSNNSNNSNNNNNNSSLNNSFTSNNSSLTVSPTKQLDKLNELNQFLSMSINDITASSITPIKRASTTVLFNSFTSRHKSEMLEYQYSQTDYQSMLNESYNEMLPPPLPPQRSSSIIQQEQNIDVQMEEDNDEIIAND